MRKNRKIKTAGILLCLVVMAGAVSGCGASGTDNAETQSRETSAVVDDKEEISAEETAAAGPAGAAADMEGISDAAEETAPAHADGGSGQEEDLTLGGIFELYTPEEYAEVVDNVKKYGAGSAEDIASMEADLERLKADNGKGEFVIYKGAFQVTYETEDGASVMTALDPAVIMIPDRMDRNFTAGEYQKVIGDMDRTLDKAIEDGLLTQEEKERILDKMNENLKKFE